MCRGTRAGRVPQVTTSNGPEVPLASASRVLCSSWARDQKLDPIGTAGCYRGYLLLEWPLPWPRDLSEDPALEPVVSLVRREGLRLQGLVPASGGGSRRIIAYRWPDGGGARFERTELVVGPGDVIAAALAILDEQPCSEETTDVLVCTHGRRDRCCGSLGTALAQELLADHRQLGDDVRLWRTSHTGGHRFRGNGVGLAAGHRVGVLRQRHPGQDCAPHRTGRRSPAALPGLCGDGISGGPGARACGGARGRVAPFRHEETRRRTRRRPYRARRRGDER